MTHSRRTDPVAHQALVKARVPAIINQFTVICPYSLSEVYRMFRPGNQPSCMAARHRRATAAKTISTMPSAPVWRL